MILHREIVNLKQRLLTLGAIVEKRLYMAVNSVHKRDPELAQQVIDGDEEIDTMEVELEEDCLKVLALHQPVATDLRVIVATMKINVDLERIGDLAVDIAERARFLATTQEVDQPFDFPGMAQKVTNMLQQCLDAFINLDVETARSVCMADDGVDLTHSGMYPRVEEAIQTQPEYIKQFLGYLSVSRYLERIADHATNIAEDVMYLVDGNIVRHNDEIFHA